MAGLSSCILLTMVHGPVMKLMWRDVHVGNVVETGRDMPDCHGEFELITSDEQLLAYIRARGRAGSHEKGLFDGFDEAFLADALDGWRLVRPDGSSVDLVVSPDIGIDEKVICWNERAV